MGGWPERAAFCVGGRAFCWADVFLFALLRGEWEPFERRLRDRTALLRGVEAQGRAPAARIYEEATTAFRHAHGLISAAETEAWLEAWDLDPRTWERVVCAARLEATSLAGGVAGGGDDLPEREVLAALWADAVCSSDAIRFARALAGVAALEADTRAEDPVPQPPRIPCPTPGSTPGPTPCSRLLRSWLGWPDVEIAARLSALARLHGAFEGRRPSRCTAPAVESIVEQHRLHWVGLDGIQVELPSESMAREARMRVCNDGELLEQVAAEAGAPAWRFRSCLEELPAELQPAASAAQPGELVGPVKTESGFVLFGLESRVAPDPADPAVRRRAEDALEERALARALHDHVSWESPLREAFV